MPATLPVPRVSIIICTCNRAAHLQKTLAALAKITLPEMPCELIIVDNGSTDHTAEVVRACRIAGLPIRYLLEARRGVPYARNAGVAAALGEIILFTDDDVHPPLDWIEAMCAPILAGSADAVAGGIRFAPHLLRPWQTPRHRAWLASTETLDPDDPEQMIGANMAFSRRVLARVPVFDCEIGPGRLGSGDEALFSFQVKQAGFRLVSAFDVAVVHHFDEARLKRSYFLGFAEKRGRVMAYVGHHWQHKSIAQPRLLLIRAILRLWFFRRTRRAEWRTSEGIPLWEMSLLENIAQYRQYLHERRRTRNYAPFGLVKQDPAEVQTAVIHVRS